MTQTFPEDVGVAIVCYNNREKLGATLASLDAAGCPRSRVLVVDGGSTDARGEQDGRTGASSSGRFTDGAPTPAEGGACVSGVGGPCGGFVQSPCTCAAGLTCQASRIPDGAGTCTSGSAPEAGVTDGAVCVDNVLCIAGDRWDPTKCKCVPASP